MHTMTRSCGRFTGVFEYASIANQLMATTHVCCEQVGFIESTQNDDGNDFHLVMSGNEFCGNATMSYIHHLVGKSFA